MKTIKTGQMNKISSSVITIMFVLFSALIMLTSMFFPMVAISAGTAKALGEEWQTFVNRYTSTSDGLKVVSATQLYKQMYPNDLKLEAGVITPITNADGTITSAIYGNTSGKDGKHNYCMTIETAEELLIFSALTYGRQYGNMTSNEDTAVSTFFKSANVKLTNNINYNGNSEIKILGQSSVILKENHGAETSYSSNGVYTGNYSGTATKLSPIIPIVGFSGIFDGQNFDVSNLKIIRNAYLNTSGYDAFFASVISGGVVKNFGLSEVSYVSTILSKNVDIAQYNKVAGICGHNAGAIDYVYNTKSSFEGTQATIVTVCDGAPATNRYSGQSTAWQNTPTTTTNVSGENFPTKTARWYSASFGDHFSAEYHQNSATSYRLNGLANTDVNAAGTPVINNSEQNYSVKTPADFVTFLQVFKEGFNRVNTSNGALTTSAKGNVYVNITQNLDFKYVGKSALIPAVDFSDAPANVTLYSLNKTDSPVIDQHKTIANMQLNTYIDYGQTYSSYGIFGSRQTESASTNGIKVRNLNFINCNVSIQDDILASNTTKETSAGLIGGYLLRPIAISCVGSNANIIATNNTNTGAANSLGGLVGSSKSSVSFSGVAVSGQVNNGVRNYSFATQESNSAYLRFSSGGIIGSNSTTSVYSNVSVSGSVMGFMPQENKGMTNAIVSCTGGLVGYGKLTNTAGANCIIGAQITAKILSAPATISGAQVTANSYEYSNNFVVNIGGIAGELIANSEMLFDCNGLDANMPAVVATTIGVTKATRKTNTTPTQTVNMGGFAGVSGTGEIKNLDTSKLFVGSESGTAPNITTTRTVFYGENGEGTELNYGNLYGNSPNGTKITSVKNTAPISIAGKFSTVSVGGISGTSDGVNTVFTSCENTAKLSVKTSSGIKLSGICATSNARNVFQSCVNSGTFDFDFDPNSATDSINVAGISYGGSLTSCKNTANISFKSASAHDVSISGISNYPNKAISNINTGNISLVSPASVEYQKRFYIGGIVSNVNAVTATIGSQINKNVNYGEISINNSSGNVRAGGIIGDINFTGSSSLSIYQNINFGKISGKCGSITYAGGIAGSSALQMNIDSCINNGEISMTGGSTNSAMGGILGYFKGTGTNVLKTQLVNSINVAGIASSARFSTGGIVGRIDNPQIKVENCVNSGMVTGGNYSGGIVGNLQTGQAGQKAEINSVLNYGNFSGSVKGGIIGQANTVTYLDGALNFGIVNGGAITDGALIGGGAPAQNTNTLSYPTDVIEITNLELDNKTETTKPTLVASEQAYNIGTPVAPQYHSSKITAKKCWALTTTEGRRAGVYLGDNYNKTEIENISNVGDTTKTSGLIAKLQFLKQIDYSRDTFLNHYESFGENILKDISLIDNAKTGENQRLPAPTYDSASNTFTITITSLTPYYTKNMAGKTSFEFNGANLRFSGAGLVVPKNMFSAGATATDLVCDTQNTKNFTFSSAATAGVISTFTTTVYQSTLPTTPPPTRYSTKYTFKVVFETTSAPTFTLADGGEENFILLNQDTPQQSEDSEKTSATTYNLNSGNSNINASTVTYQFINAENNKEIVPSWVYSKFTASFLYTNIPKTNIDAITFELTSGASVIIYNTYISITKPNIAQGQTSGIYTLNVELTNRRNLQTQELPNGQYALKLKVKISDGVFLERIFSFTKEQSGNVFLHVLTSVPGKLASDDNISITLTDIANKQPEKSIAIKQNLIDTFTIDTSGIKNVYNFTINKELPYYGAMPKIGSNNGALNFYGQIGAATDLYGSQTLVKGYPKVVIKKKSDVLLGFEYIFEIKAQNGDIGHYSHNYYYNSVPQGANKLNNSDTLTATVSKTGSASFTAAHDFTTANAFVNTQYYSNMTLVKTEVWYTADSSIASKKLGYFAGANFTAVGSIAEMTLPTFGGSGLSPQINYAVNTTSGVYTFKPIFKYNATYTPASGDNVTIFDTNGSPLTSITLGEFYNDNQNYTITKVGSRNAYLRNITFSGNVESGIMLGSNGRGSSPIEVSNLIINTQTKSTDLEYKNSYVDPDTNSNDYLNDPNRFRVFRIIPRFPELDDDYTTFIKFRLEGTYGFAGQPAETKFYNDEYTQIYSMTSTDNGLTWVQGALLTKTEYYVKAKAGEQADKDGDLLIDGKKVVDYQTCEVFLPEGTLVRVRVKAGIELYTNDYEFYSGDAVRNKTFKVNISSDITSQNKSFITSVRKISTSISNNGKYTRTTSLLYNTKNTNNLLYDAILNTTTSTYSKEYNNPYNTSGKYIIMLDAGAIGYKAVLTSATTGVVGDVTIDSTNPNIFVVTSSDNPMTITLNIQIVKAPPPWGDQIYS